MVSPSRRSIWTCRGLMMRQRDISECFDVNLRLAAKVKRQRAALDRLERRLHDAQLKNLELRVELARLKKSAWVYLPWRGYIA